MSISPGFSEAFCFSDALRLRGCVVCVFSDLGFASIHTVSETESPFFAQEESGENAQAIISREHTEGASKGSSGGHAQSIAQGSCVRARDRARVRRVC